MQTFAPIWLTSENQLRSLGETYSRASLANKLLSRFDIPPTAPQLRGILVPWARAPVAFQSAGELAVTEDAVHFTARRQSVFGWRLVNVDDSLAFTLRAHELVRVESFAYSSPVARLFDLPFVRVHTTRDGALSQLLLCVGGMVNKRYIARETARLLDVLQVLNARVAAT